MMGSHCVPSLTIGPLLCEALRARTTAPIAVRLMAGPVDRIIADFASAGANIMTFAPEVCEHAERIAHKRPHPVSLPCPAAAARAGRWTVPPAMR